MRASHSFLMPASSERPEGSRPGRGPAALLGGSGAGPLWRVRRLFLALALAACVIAALALAGVPDKTLGLRLAGVVSVGALAAVWLRTARRGALSSWDEPTELLALFAVGLAVGPEAALAVVYTGLYHRTLYASRPRAAAGLAIYAAAYLGAVVAGGGDDLSQAIEQLPPLAVGCAIVQAFAAMLVRHERSLERERILRDASTGLVDARDRASIYEATMSAVEQLGDGSPPAAVIALFGEDGRDLTIRAATGPWLPDVVGQPVVAAELAGDLVATLERGRPQRVESPRQAGLELHAPPDLGALAGVCLPLSVHGRLHGFLAAFGPGLDGSGEGGALTALAGEAALALAAADAADSIADDRSIERLTNGSRRE